MEIAKACDGNRSLRIEIATRDEIRDVIAMDKSLAAIQIACGDGAAKFNATNKLCDGNRNLQISTLVPQTSCTPTKIFILSYYWWYLLAMPKHQTLLWTSQHT